MTFIIFYVNAPSNQTPPPFSHTKKGFMAVLNAEFFHLKKLQCALQCLTHSNGSPPTPSRIPPTNNKKSQRNQPNDNLLSVNIHTVLVTDYSIIYKTVGVSSLHVWMYKLASKIQDRWIDNCFFYAQSTTVISGRQ